MLRVNRPVLPSVLQSALAHWQQAVNNNTIDGDPWKRFHEQDGDTKNGLLALLKTTFHGLSPSKQIRAEYTIRLLKLNERRLLVEGRLTTLRQFLDWVEMLARFGPEFELPSGYTIRQRLLDMLDCHKPYLAPIRQLFHDDPSFYVALLAKIPELAAVIAEWHLPVVNVDE